MKVKGIKRGLSFLCIIVLIISILSGCQNTLDIKFNVKKGDKYKVVVTSAQKISEEISDQKMNIDQTLKTSYLYNVTDVDSNGTATVDIKYDAVSVKTAAGNQTYEFDSSKPNDKADVQGSAYKALVGQSFTVKISQDGSIKEIKGIDKLFTNIIDKLQISDQKTKDTLTDTLKQSFGDDAMKQSLGSMTEMYPKNKKIKVGDSWEDKQTISVGYPMTINNKWTLKAIEGDILTLDADSSIDANNSSEPMDLMGVKVKYALKGTQTGTMKLTKSNGFIQSGEVNQNITGTMNMEANDILPNGMSVPLTMEGKTTYEVTKQ
ncbi:MAG: DUF6263 family protein [Bacillota bacterium]|nr:DUF6263 family protein [Bacillota bacterium]